MVLVFRKYDILVVVCPCRSLDDFFCRGHRRVEAEVGLSRGKDDLDQRNACHTLESATQLRRTVRAVHPLHADSYSFQVHSPLDIYFKRAGGKAVPYTPTVLVIMNMTMSRTV